MMEAISNSLKLLRYLGYGLLLLGIFDLIEMLVPMRLMNPVWEFQTFGLLVERIAVPLLALVLIFLGRKQERGKWEKPILKLLSWSSLIFGIILLLLIPLILIDTWRISQSSRITTESQLNQPIAQVENAKKQLQSAKTKTDLEIFLNKFDSQGRNFTLEDSQVKDLKVQLQQEIALAEGRIQQTKQMITSEQRNLWKASLKWNLGGLVSAILFIAIWYNTDWARKRHRKSKRHHTSNQNVESETM